ncbi:helix-turn-helix domain-containing protein [Paenibacillus sp. N3.4]|uniref:helix-turn-helix domain-containing protein n=1 Tax=Paenibacillus sp. N3.4 TaxID=2603222 RepID=UPI0011CAFBFC|nr:AraC family transcriptional regulator [Paenibacillus sp. N3.4]TXK84882.1 helix-turn-helix transcriptional regulator [Paenibacillus sp. N3.4]
MRNNWSVHHAAYAYWLQKAQFLLEKDTYENWSMFAVEEGRFHYCIGDKEGEAGNGDLVVCPPRIPFRRKMITPLTFHFVQFVWEEEPGKEERGELTGKVTVEDRTRLFSTFAYLRRSGERWYEEPMKSRLRHWLCDLWRIVESERKGGETEDTGRGDPVMQKARQWLLAHAFAPFSMKELSASLGMTPVQFTRRFHSVYQINPSDFVSDLRLGRAGRMLEETKLTLDEIAHRCGYENGFYLSRIFRKKKGMNPSIYRKLHQV